MDFRDTFPRYCNICTTHTPSEIDGNWAVTLLSLVVGTHLDMNTRSEIEALLLKWKTAGFDFRVMANFTEAQVMSDDMEKLPAAGPGAFRTQSLIMPDPLKPSRSGGQTCVRFCFYFPN